MVLELFTNRKEKEIKDNDPVSILFSFDTPDDRFLGQEPDYENETMKETHRFDDIVYATLRKENEEEVTPGILLSRDSLKLLHAALGAYLGK